MDISAVYMKSASTVLLAVDEDIPESRLDQINKALGAYKELGDGSYKLVNWVTYHSRSGRQNSDDDEYGENHNLDDA